MELNEDLNEEDDDAEVEEALAEVALSQEVKEKEAVMAASVQWDGGTLSTIAGRTFYGLASWCHLEANLRILSLKTIARSLLNLAWSMPKRFSLHKSCT